MLCGTGRRNVRGKTCNDHCEGRVVAHDGV